MPVFIIFLTRYKETSIGTGFYIDDMGRVGLSINIALATDIYLGKFSVGRFYT